MHLHAQQVRYLTSSVEIKTKLDALASFGSTFVAVEKQNQITIQIWLENARACTQIISYRMLYGLAYDKVSKLTITVLFAISWT